MSKVNVLVSTMNRNDLNFLKDMYLRDNVVVVNQTTNNQLIDSKRIDSESITVVNSFDRGLSKSRNLALKNSESDISIIADDDVMYYPNFENKVIEAYDKFPDADVIAFKVHRIGQNSNREKSFSDKEKNINYLTSMKISSVEITFKTKSIKVNNIRFNENIGAGTEFMMGEENQFLFDCLKSNLNIKYVPIEIAEVDVSDSTWFNGFDDNYFISTGAKFYNMSHVFYPLFIFQFAIRKTKLYKNNYSFFEVIKVMFSGVEKYKKKQTEKLGQ